MFTNYVIQGIIPSFEVMCDCCYYHLLLLYTVVHLKICIFLTLVMIATKEQMVSAKLPLEDRDYCAHKLLEYRGCRSEVFPFVYKCAHERHAYLTCEYEEYVSTIYKCTFSKSTHFSYVLRMKEFERERRLRDRQAQLDKRNEA